MGASPSLPTKCRYPNALASGNFSLEFVSLGLQAITVESTNRQIIVFFIKAILTV
jgi:hypothetical protein